ncbi:membrane protein [Actinoplanes teichomyceticus]|nr:membrane protein [Actinoplanes teichomyceticus]
MWLRLAAGVLAVVMGIVAFAWPSATLRVVGLLFGSQLLVMGVVRAAQLLVDPDTPVVQRVLGVIFGVLTGLVGIVCLRNVAGSLVLLLVIVAVGWLLDGLAEIFTTIGDSGVHPDGAGWRLATGLCAVLAAIAVLVWPGLGLATFLFIGATTLVFVGLCQILIGVSGLRAHPA